MKFALFSFVLQLVIAGTILSQPVDIDSLTRVTARLPDNREKAENYIKLVRHYVNVNRDSLLFYADKAEQLAQRLQYFPVLADVIHIKSSLLKFRGQLDEALLLNTRFLEIADSLHDNTRLAKGFLNRGDILYEKLEFDSALYNFRKSFELFYALNDSMAIGAVHNSI
jgi:tetratricopeptide (TPR) repeat protein